ncbi:hypothetical protein LOTGIDRAFT_145406 [Lottia gigantea]|uniref:Lipase domain-containing protein n=1 Tax=Lottia gigantea TaxID=225164 RepID=V4AHT4_LOTGI|nr:hypothetical protein LOTGIDRAFT_145406 [Lottia gigantea]ESO92956.1 hypothetical protein LOTGIDRAFT_145406 [Lottia gigantea]
MFSGWLGLIQPQNFDVDFWLYTKGNKDSAETISTTNLGSRFISGAKTIFVIHGYLNTGTQSWIAPMKNALLALPDSLNVIVVNWKDGAFSTYAQSADNTKTVGRKAGDLIKALKESKGMDYDDFHVIGHSLGAHAAGFTGKRITDLTGSKIGRITGLDPAGYNFAIADEANRLAKEDGAFVDVMHTNTVKNNSETVYILISAFGTPIGHVDFYPNGGRSQPGCCKYA